MNKINDKVKPFLNNENPKLKRLKDSRIKIFKKITALLELSTSHGIPNIVRSNRISVKILWTICFLVSVSICSFMVFKGASDYLQHETVSKIEYITEIPTKFPTVSFCNLNPFVTNFSEQWMISILPSLGYNNSLDKLIKAENIYYLSLLNLATQLFLNKEDHGYAIRKLLGYNLSSLLIECHYNQENCDYKNFKWYYDLNYGNCFSFNSGYDESDKELKILENLKPGPKNGLKLQFFLRPGQNKYSAGINEGLRVFIHNNSVNPSTLTGINVEPSKRTDIAIQRTFIQKEPDPYSDCISLENFDSYYYKFLIGLNRTYRQQDCFDLCLQKKVIEECKCFDMNFPMIYNSTQCISLVDYFCSLNVSYNFKKSKIDDECLKLCPLECESIKYDLLISNAGVLSENGYFIYKNLINNISAKYGEYNLSYDEVKKRLVVVDIYYSDMSYIKISEAPKTSFFDLLSNLGGTLGLYIGISFLSLVELVEIFLEIFFISFNF